MAKRTSRSQANEGMTSLTSPQAQQNDPDELRTSSDDKRSMSMASEPSQEDIRRRAYQRYVERGGEHGRDFDDWLHAERELRSKK